MSSDNLNYLNGILLKQYTCVIFVPPLCVHKGGTRMTHKWHKWHKIVDGWTWEIFRNKEYLFGPYKKTLAAVLLYNFVWLFLFLFCIFLFLYHKKNSTQNCIKFSQSYSLKSNLKTGVTSHDLNIPNTNFHAYYNTNKKYSIFLIYITWSNYKNLVQKLF